jgi:hypothetical protein
LELSGPPLALDVPASRLPLKLGRLLWLAPILSGFVLVSLVIATSIWVAMPPGLWVTSDPSSADVYLGDELLGQTPLYLSGRGGEPGLLRVQLAGHEAFTRAGDPNSRGVVRVNATLAPLAGTLLLESEPSGATVWLDGRDVGVTPLSFGALSAGLHRVNMSTPDYVDGALELRMPPGGALSERVVLRPMPARLHVSLALGAAQVYLDDQPRGLTPLELEVEPGAHQLRLGADGYRGWEEELELAPNEVRRLELSLQRKWPGFEDADEIFPLAVIVENQEQSRPQSGLDRADVVYEALAEGGITRFLALYATETAPMVGPVRSARHYFAHWAREYLAPLVHIGASPQGYDAIFSDGLRTVDEFKGPAGFWRIRERQAPHNAYTSTEGAWDVLGRQRLYPGSFGGLTFKDHEGRVIGMEAPRALITYGAWNYRVSWEYDARENDYLRFMEGQPHVDAQSSDQLRAANVLVQWVDSWPIPGDTEKRLDFQQIGSGRLIALVDGVAIEGTWSKSSLDAPTHYVDRAGNPIHLNAGPTWIQVLPMGGVLDL